MIEKPRITQTDAPETAKKTGVDFDKFKTNKKPSMGLSDIDSFLSDEYQKKASIDLGNEDLTAAKPRRTRQKAPKEMFISGDIITGALLITFIDLFIPMIIVTVNNLLDPSGKKVKIEQLRMKIQQRKELEPIADALAKEIELKANPWLLMIAALIGIYGLNFVNIKVGINE